MTLPNWEWELGKGERPMGWNKNRLNESTKSVQRTYSAHSRQKSSPQEQVAKWLLREGGRKWEEKREEKQEIPLPANVPLLCACSLWYGMCLQPAWVSCLGWLKAANSTQPMARLGFCPSKSRPFPQFTYHYMLKASYQKCYFSKNCWREPEVTRTVPKY